MHHLIFSILGCCPFGQPIFEAQHGRTHLYTSFIFSFPELSSFPTKNSAFDLSNSLPLRALCYSIWSLGTTTMLQEIVVAFCSQQLLFLSVVSGVTVVCQQISWDIEYLAKTGYWVPTHLWFASNTGDELRKWYDLSRMLCGQQERSWPERFICKRR